MANCEDHVPKSVGQTMFSAIAVVVRSCADDPPAIAHAPDRAIKWHERRFGQIGGVIRAAQTPFLNHLARSGRGPGKNPMSSAESSRSLEMAIVDTVREPLIVLDEVLRAVVASRSFYQVFRVSREETENRLFCDLGNKQWNIPSLRELLLGIIPQHTTIEEYEVRHDFPTIGERTMLLNARKIFYEGNGSTSILVALEDITERRKLEKEKEGLLREKDELLRQKDLLLQEMHHRVNNSLHIIASILLLKAQTVQSEETRKHLQDAHERVMAVATVQEQLQPSPFGSHIEARTYLTRLCESLASSMILDSQPVTLRVEAGEGTTTSDEAVSMGLIAVELIINALKHAFPGGVQGTIIVGFESSGSAWRLTVSDDGIGISSQLPEKAARSGLGTSIIEALTRQLGGRVATSVTPPGTTVSITVPRSV
jgi:two-component sensor histidine kinase